MRKQNNQSRLPAPTAHPAHRQVDGFFMENAMSQPEESGLERDYCAGQLSLRDLAEIYGISEGAIRKRAKSMAGYARERAVRKKVRRYAKAVRKNQRCVPRRIPKSAQKS